METMPHLNDESREGCRRPVTIDRDGDRVRARLRSKVRSKVRSRLRSKVRFNHHKSNLVAIDRM